MSSNTTLNMHSAFIVDAAHKHSIVHVATKPPGPNQVQVAVKAVCLTGSDCQYYKYGKNGDDVIRAPLVLGQEGVGRVVSLGANITKLNVGDLVVMEPKQPCEKCKHCNEGKYNYCSNMVFSGSASERPHIQGMLQARYNHHADFVHVLTKAPAATSHIAYARRFAAQAVQAHTLAVALHAVRRSAMIPAESVMIIGAGQLGLVIAKVVQTLYDPDTITMVDSSEDRLDFASSMRFSTGEPVIDYTFSLPTIDIPANPVVHGRNMAQGMLDALPRDLPVGSLPDIIFECTGSEANINLAVNIAALQARIVVAGVRPVPLPQINMDDVVSKELSIVGVQGYAEMFKEAVEHIDKGVVDLGDLVSHEFEFEEVEIAFARCLNQAVGVRRCVLHF